MKSASEKPVDFLKFKTFQKRALAVVPNLPRLELSSEEWSHLMHQSEQQNISHLTPYFIVASLSKLKSIPYDDLIAALANPQAKRKAKSSLTPEASPTLKRKRSRANEEEGPNALILKHSPSKTELHSPISKTGARIAPLHPATPERGYTNVKQTPGKTKVRLFYSNSSGAYFKPLTPYHPNGMVNTEEVRRESIQEKAPKLKLNQRPGSVQFTATKAQLLERQNSFRSRSQNNLMGESCRTVFEAHGVKTMVRIRGSEYHWSHLIAYFLGGDQNKENLIPATAASNYMTLEVVEDFIANKLTSDEVSSIDILVEPIYNGPSLIPDELKFNLHWQKSGKDFHEQININPRSYQQMTGSMRNSIQLLREFDDPTETNTEETSFLYPPQKP